MTVRDQQLLAIRPTIASIRITDNMSRDERFQNLTLRPIIKLQNDLFIEVFRNYIAKHKNVFYELTTERRLHFIDNAIHKDIKFRNSLKGMVIGQFTTEEYLNYIENSSALNKRMMNIVIQRLQSNIQLFENPRVLLAV
ncbi:glyoxalase [Lacinutrix chionoecetis]